jgi:hypothetical protein
VIGVSLSRFFESLRLRGWSFSAAVLPGQKFFEKTEGIWPIMPITLRVQFSFSVR